MQTVDLDDQQVELREVEASQAFIFLRDSATKAAGKRPTSRCRRHALRQVALGQTDRAVVLAGRHVQDHQVERPLEQQVAVAQHLPALQTHLLASMVANPWPLHFHAAAVVADLALRMAPAITPTVPMATMSGPAHGRGVLLHHLGQGLDPGQETEPIHAETDCVHRVCQRRHRKRGGKGFRATGNYGYSFPWCRSPSWVCSTRSLTAPGERHLPQLFQHRPGHLRVVDHAGGTAGGQDGDLRPFGAAEVAAMSAATSPGTGLAYGLRRVCGRLGHGPLLVLRHDPPASTPSSRRQSVGDRSPAISDQALLVAIEADLEASPWRARATARSGLGFGSVATSGLPASGCSA